MKKSHLLLIVLGLLSTALNTFAAENGKADQKSSAWQVTVYRSPSCGCCGAWIEHLKKNGFEVVEHQTGDMNTVKDRFGVPLKLRSCHTALVDGYVIEGHVPATEIRRLLWERPQVKGLAVPVMPSGSPGMEVSGRKDAYSVLQFTQDGKTEVYQEYQ